MALRRSRRKGVTVASVRTAKGYGKKMSSPDELPPGGLSKSPAYKLVAARCGSGARPPPPKKRAGAPLKGGFPLKRWPVNVLVDGERAFWLPDDWGQGVKNTGPGGTYVVWMSPAGRIFYHRPTMEQYLGRELSALDGFNGILRTVQCHLVPKADQRFFKEQLTAKERRHLLPADRFHFGIVSARRASTLEGTHDIMTVEAHFRHMGVRPTWYVDAPSLEDYKRLTLNAVVGGKLTPARNKALEDAQRRGKICVQVSDDISRWEYVACKKIDTRGETDFSKANAAVAKAKKYHISPVGAAQFLLAKMRSGDGSPKLGGVHPNANAAQAISQAEVTSHHFILGDFFVADKSPCRFDGAMTLKEDYDFTCSHMDRHGSVLRCNRLFLHVKHSTNAGGAVSTRDGAGVEERKNIAILMQKWPGAFSHNGRRKDEVVLNWSRRHTAQEAAARAKPAAAGAKGSKPGKSSRAERTLAGSGLRGKAMLAYSGKEAGVPYITRRCQRCHGRTVQEVVESLRYPDAQGRERRYGLTDLKYDIACGRLTTKGSTASSANSKKGAVRRVKLGLRS